MAWRARALELLDAEGVRADDRDLLEVERRPLEAPRHLDAGDDDRAARRRDADAHLDRLREADRVVDDVDAAAVEPRHAVPRRQHLRRPSRAPTRSTIVGDRLVRQHDVRAEALRQRALVREARHREHRGSRVEQPQDGDGEQPERAAAVDEHGRALGRAAASARACSDTENGSASTASSSRTLVGDRDAHRLVRRDVRREAAGRRAAVAGVDAGRDDAAARSCGRSSTGRPGTRDRAA